MALNGGNFGMTVSFMDNAGDIVTREYMMSSLIATYAAAETAAIEMIVDIELLTNAEISQYRVFRAYVEDALIFPGTGVQVENRASLTFQLVGVGSKKANLTIPAPEFALFVGTSGPQANTINTTNTNLLNFTDNFKTSGNFRLSDGEAVTRILNGKRTHVKSSKG